MAGAGRVPMPALTVTGIALLAASVASALARPLSSTGGWMPRARSRRSASASTALRCAASISSRTVALSPSWSSSPSFSRAMPRFMASAASRICAPSCRSRSTRRSAAAESSTASARVRSSSLTRSAMLLGPSRPRTSRASAALIPRASHAAATTHAAPARAAGKAPSQLPTRIFPPNGTGTTATRGVRVPPWWLRNSSQIAG